MSEIAPKGRLFGRNVLEGIFRAAPDEDLFLGELLVGVDETTGRRYLFRVVDVTYGTEHREPGWAERVAGTIVSNPQGHEADAHEGRDELQPVQPDSPQAFHGHHLTADA